MDTSSDHRRIGRQSTPILLCNADYYGTLAAVRSLGRAGVPVVTADPAALSPARYSRYTRRHMRCPAFGRTGAFAEWLLKFGSRGVRHAIYATSDDVSFALALHRDALSQSFALYQPDIETMMRILDKGQMHEHARAVGFELPETWVPGSRRDVERLARELEGPLLLKPRTQIGRQIKGAVVGPRPDALLAQYDKFVAQVRFEKPIRDRLGEATQPMVQRYHPEAMEGIYSLSGFRDRSGRMSPLLGAKKVLQRPRRIGIGLCFDSAPTDPGIAERTKRLLDRIGYYGVFELEFIRAGGRALLIDLNARFYNQLMFDIARGLELPRLAYAGAIGDDAEVARLMDGMPPDAGAREFAFCNRFGMDVAIGMQSLLGTMSRDEAARWHAWRTRTDRPMVNAVSDDDDPLPYACDVANQVLDYARHPRAFLRQVGLAK
jgi:predicted ATP-grasp superfamily ATP-dependent carboligase